METCKECEHYQGLNFDGPMRTTDGEKAVMFCPKLVDTGGNGYHKDIFRCGNADGFTPKKPKEKSCSTCRLSREQEGGCPKIGTITCGTIGDFQAWRPIKPDKPKAEVAEKKCVDCAETGKGYLTANCSACMSKSNFRPKCERCKYKGNQDHCWPLRETPVEECFTPKMPSPEQLTEIVELTDNLLTPNSKEKTMLKKLKHLWRMIGTAWHYYLIYILCGFAHPSVMWYGEKFYIRTKPSFEWNPAETESIIFSWLVAILSVAIVIVTLYAHHRYTKWYHGEK